MYKSRSLVFSFFSQSLAKYVALIHLLVKVKDKSKVINRCLLENQFKKLQNHDINEDRGQLKMVYGLNSQQCCANAAFLVNVHICYGGDSIHV